MALGDVIGRPLVNPIEGLASGVQAGFEIAQNQERLRLANEELLLKKQQIDNDFIEKGMTAIANIAKAKGGGKKFYAKLAIKYMRHGGLEIDEESLLQDPEMPDNFAKYASYLDRMFPGTSVENINQKKAAWQQFYSNDPERVKPFVESADAELKSLLAQQAFGAQTSEIAKREAVKKVVSSEYPGWMKQQMIANPTEALPLVSQFDPVFEGLKQTRENMKRADLVPPQKRADLTRRINQGLAAIQSPDTFNQGVMMLQGVNEEASGMVAESAQAKQAQMTQRSQIAQSGIERRFRMNIEEQRGKEADKKVDQLTTSVGKVYSESSAVLKNLESIYGTQDAPRKPSINEVKTTIASFARTIQAERGALSNADVSRVLANTLNFDVKRVQAYLFGDASAPEGMVDNLRKNLSTFKKNLVTAQIKKVTDEMRMEKKNPRIGKFFKSDGYARQQMRDFANNLLQSSGSKSAVSLKAFADDRVKKKLPINDDIIDAYEESMLNKGMRILP